MSIGESKSLEFIYTPLCERMCRELLDDDAIRQVERVDLTPTDKKVLRELVQQLEVGE